MTQHDSPPTERAITQVTRSVAWLMSGRLLRLVIGAVVYVFVARYLKPAEFGLLAAALALASILEIAGRLGLNQLVLRDIVRTPEAAGQLLATVIGLRSLCALVSVVVATLSGALIFRETESAPWIFFVVALSLFPTLICDTYVLWFQSRTEARIPVLMDTLSFMTGNVSRILLLATGGPLIGFALIPLIARTVQLVGVMVVANVSRERLKLQTPRAQAAVVLLRENWPLVFTQFAGIVYLKIDQVMLGGLASAREAGIYGVTLRISEVWYFVPAALCISLKPTLTRTRDTNPARYQQILQATYSTMTLMALAAAIPTTLFAGSLVNMLFGAAYAGVAPVLTIHIWTGIFVFWRRVQSEWMINEGHLKFGLFRAVFGAVTNIALNLFLIPAHGAVGAAIATLVASFLVVIPANCLFAPARAVLKLQLKSLYFVGLSNALSYLPRVRKPVKLSRAS